LIGDEFDTTDKKQHQGITHYNGLFDQSRYFDETLTRYYHRKGWGISQFSILRPFSELLIEKTLAERYPELLPYQMSCHATHKEGNQMRPCGKCEKCRRIITMLVALGKDPKICGYSEKQIQRCLEESPDRDLYQEIPGVQHLAKLLFDQRKISIPKIGKIKARPHAEVLKLRFDAEHSPTSAVPNDLRIPLYRLISKHTDGMVKRVGKVWMDMDFSDEKTFAEPYEFRSNPAANSETSIGLSLKFLLAELTWPEAEERFKQVDLALLPVGSIEQHGPHLPLDTDAFDADYLAKKVAEACSDPKPLVLPLIPYGVSYAHEDFSGTISIGPDTLSRLVYEIGMNVAKQGITKLFIINGHGGNSPALHFAAQMINRDAHIFTCVDTGETSDPDVEAISTVPNDVHAGDIETSTALATRPWLVRQDHTVKFIPEFSSSYLDFTSKRSVGWYARTAKISPSGVFGDSTQASRERGEAIWKIMIQRLVEMVESLKRMSLDEIYQKSL
jgi:creatinine amidohydrolase/Fe(II)-dependent formamide hydrolase-like protein